MDAGTCVWILVSGIKRPSRTFIWNKMWSTDFLTPPVCRKSSNGGTANRWSQRRSWKRRRFRHEFRVSNSEEAPRHIMEPSWRTSYTSWIGSSSFHSLAAAGVHVDLKQGRVRVCLCQGQGGLLALVFGCFLNQGKDPCLWSIISTWCYRDYRPDKTFATNTIFFTAVPWLLHEWWIWPKA